MKLGEAKDYFVLRESATQKFYSDTSKTTDDILEARRFSERGQVEEFQNQVGHAHISSVRNLPMSPIVHIRITVDQL